MLARAVRQLFAIALEQYRRTLQKHGVLDFSDVLQRTLGAARRRWRSSRAAASSSSRAISTCSSTSSRTPAARSGSWSSCSSGRGRPGSGLTERELEPSIFIVGDRKQSIYGFRDAEVAVLDEAARYIEALRPIGQVRTAITRSFRSVRELLHFVNDVFAAIEKAPDARRRVPLRRRRHLSPERGRGGRRRGARAGRRARRTSSRRNGRRRDRAAAGGGATVRDRDTGVRRAARPGDIAILFRTREGHRLFEDALARRRVPVLRLQGARILRRRRDQGRPGAAVRSWRGRSPSCNAAAFLRSRFVRLSDEALKRLAPGLVGGADRATPPPARRRSASRRPAAAGAGARERAASGWRWSIGCRRRSCSIACWPSRRTRRRSAGRRIARRART